MTKELVKLVDGEPVVSTLDMWQSFEVGHNALMDLIRKYEDDFREAGNLSFLKARIKKGAGRPAEYCYLNEEQTTFLLTLMRNSEVVVPFKKRLTKEFFRMRNLLVSMASQPQNAEWLETREYGKVQRKIETDTIKKFNEYAKAQGSKKYGWNYKNITDAENNALFTLEQKFANVRDNLDLHQLLRTSQADMVVACALKDGMDSNLPYKEVKELVAKRLEGFVELVGKSIVPIKLQVTNEKDS